MIDLEQLDGSNSPYKERVISESKRKGFRLSLFDKSETPKRAKPRKLPTLKKFYARQAHRLTSESLHRSSMNLNPVPSKSSMSDAKKRDA